jgi:stress-induced morphogen
MDVAIVSPDFSGKPFYDRKTLVPFLLKCDSRIEVHPFRPEDFSEENEFAREILESGLQLKV